MFTRRKVTIPAAGQTQIINLSGSAVVVESISSYSSPEQVPTLSFGDQSGAPQPLYGQSTYVTMGGFDKLAINGTSESAGDTVYLLSSDQCLEEDININVSGIRRATLKDTFSITANDTIQTLSEIQVLNASGLLPSAMYITARGGAVAYAFGSDPEQADELGHILNNGEVQKIVGINFITAFNFIAAVAAATPEISFTMEY